MKKRILSIALTLCMLLSIVPMTPIVATAASAPSGVELKMDGTTLKYGDTEVEKTGDTGLQVIFDPSNENCIATVNGYVLNGGTYYLNSDVTIDKPLIIKDGTKENPVTLDLNGHVLKYENATQKNSVIVVADSAYFVLQDSEPSSQHHFTKNDTGLYTLSNDANSPITLTGGVITGGTGTKIYADSDSDIYGGGVFVGSEADFTMTGGNIVGCTAASTGVYNAHGGGVFVGSEADFTMTGGSIVGCTAASTGQYNANGGGVCVRENADFTMNNARITNCTAKSNGGGVYINNLGTFTMQGSTIENCTANSCGGGVSTEGTFTMESGTIENCIARSIGGGVYVDDNSFNMKGGTIKNCKASSTSDVVYINSLAMDAQGGSVYGGVYNNATLKNTSAEGSTILYPGTTVEAIVEGGNGPIMGKRITFMSGGATYAETLVGVDGINNHLSTAKISQPADPSTQVNKHVAWTFTKADGSGTETWDFDKTFAENAPECVDDELNTTSDPRTGMKVILTAEWHTLEKVDAKAATCTEAGISTECWYCETCNKYFMDNKGTEVATDVTTAIDSNNHVGTLGEWQKDENSHWKTYSCCTTVKGAEGTHNFGMNDKCECGAVQYTVTFDANGGTVGTTTATTNAEGKLTSIPTPIRQNHSFLGWFTEDGDMITTETVFTEPTTVCAQWQILSSSFLPTWQQWELIDKIVEANKKKDEPVEVKPVETEPEETEPVEEVEPAWSNPFADVTETDAFYDAIKFVYENGYMNGMSENTFAPNEGLTRAMLVTVLYRAAGAPVMDEANPFTDVANDAWYYNAVVWAKSIGLINGITETEFAPDDELTREQLVTIFYRYAEFLGYDLSIGEDTNILSYEDFADIAEYAIPAMQWACGAGLIDGAEGNILPQESATRALVAMVLLGFYA